MQGSFTITASSVEHMIVKMNNLSRDMTQTIPQDQLRALMVAFFQGNHMIMTTSETMLPTTESPITAISSSKKTVAPIQASPEVTGASKSSYYEKCCASKKTVQMTFVNPKDNAPFNHVGFPIEEKTVGGIVYKVVLMKNNLLVAYDENLQKGQVFAFMDKENQKITQNIPDMKNKLSRYRHFNHPNHNPNGIWTSTTPCPFLTEDSAKSVKETAATTSNDESSPVARSKKRSPVSQKTAMKSSTYDKMPFEGERLNLTAKAKASPPFLDEIVGDDSDEEQPVLKKPKVVKVIKVSGSAPKPMKKIAVSDDDDGDVDAADEDDDDE